MFRYDVLLRESDQLSCDRRRPGVLVSACSLVSFFCGSAGGRNRERMFLVPCHGCQSSRAYHDNTRCRHRLSTVATRGGTKSVRTMRRYDDEHLMSTRYKSLSINLADRCSSHSGSQQARCLLNRDEQEERRSERKTRAVSLLRRRLDTTPGQCGKSRCGKRESAQTLRETQEVPTVTEAGQQSGSVLRIDQSLRGARLE